MENSSLTLALIIAVTLFAMNMGASGIAPSFASLYGAKLISHKKASLLFTIFVFIGAILIGKNVAHTLSKNIVPSEYITPNVALFMITAPTIGLFIANFLKIPQSTSWATVFAITGAGAALGHVKVKTFFFMIPLWIIMPVISYFITYVIYRKIYPPRETNFQLHEKLLHHEKKIKKIGIISSCYIAFSIGTNNVANAVGPLTGANLINPIIGLAIISPLFGFGGLILGKKIMSTIGKEIVPLGLISSALINFISATLLVFASIIGLPQSLVQLNAASILAISSLKNGHTETINHNTVQKTFLVWTITPIIAFLIGFGLVKIFLVGV
jgi:sulfate permease